MIFVVDDDDRIRSATAAAIRAMGHDVREFSDGPAALAALQDGRPDLLVTDVLMPGMKGTELAAKAGVARVLFISGDIGNTAAHEFGGHELLAKPFTAFALNAAVSRTLSAT